MILYEKIFFPSLAWIVHPAPSLPPPPMPPIKGAVKKSQWTVKMPDKDEQMLRHYSAQGYLAINQYLRSEPRQKPSNVFIDSLLSLGCLDEDSPNPVQIDRAAKNYVRGVERALAKLPSSHHQIVYRGLSLEKYSDLLNCYTTIGNTIIEKGFLSTSPDKAWVNDSILRIFYCPDTREKFWAIWLIFKARRKCYFLRIQD